MIHTDTFLEIGSQHRTCEDYIIQGNSPAPYIILADGCSSSLNTEMGARILCHLAKQYLRYRQDDIYEISYEKMGQWIIHNAEMTVRQLGLNLSCLDATLIIALHNDYDLRIFMYGDGAIVQKFYDQKPKITIVEFTSNAPYYLSYKIDDDRHSQYHEMKTEKQIGVYSGSEPINFEDQAYDYPTELKIDVRDFDVLFICSDGIQSFLVENPSERRILSPVEMLDDFMAFKNVKGEYLKRRMKRELKDLRKRGINHYDDLSIGSFMRT